MRKRNNKAAGLYLLLSAFTCVFLIAGCKKEIKSAAELETQVKKEEKKLTQTVEKKDFKVTMVYRPTSALMAREYKRFEEEKLRILASPYSKSVKDSILSAKMKEIKEQEKSYDRSLYFLLTLGYTDGKRDIEYESMKAGHDNYSRWMQKLAYEMNRYIYLETPKVSEVPLAIYQMDRTFGLTKDRSFLLVFPRQFNNTNLTGDDWLRVNVREFGLDVGEVSFKYELPFDVEKTVISYEL